jgi:hypothetical protein
VRDQSHAKTSRGQEVLRDQPKELRQVAQVALARTGLPGCGGRDTHRGSRREVRRHWRPQMSARWTTGQPVLQLQDKERQHGTACSKQ